MDTASSPPKILETQMMQGSDHKGPSAPWPQFKQVHVSLPTSTHEVSGDSAKVKPGQAQAAFALEGWPWKGVPQLADCKDLDEMLGRTGFVVCKVAPGGSTLHLRITFDSGETMRKYTVEQLKDLLEAEAGIPRSRQILVQAGVDVQDKSLALTMGPLGIPSFILMDKQQGERESIIVTAGEDRHFELEVSLTDTLGQLKSALEKDSGVPKGSMTLLTAPDSRCTAMYAPFMTSSGFCQVPDAWRLGALCLFHRRSLTMAQQISVSAMTIAGALCSVNVASSDTVLQLKTALMGEIGISPCKQILLLDTTVLQDLWVLLEHGIASDTVLTLVKKPENAPRARLRTPSDWGSPFASPCLSPRAMPAGFPGMPSAHCMNLCCCHSGTPLSPPFWPWPLWAPPLTAGYEACGAMGHMTPPHWPWSAPLAGSSSAVDIVDPPSRTIELRTTTPASSSTAVVRLRGLPFRATASEIVSFFTQHDIVEPKEVELMSKSNGRPSGQALVTMHEQKDAQHVQRVLEGQYMRGRYIEVFPHFVKV